MHKKTSALLLILVLLTIFLLVIAIKQNTQEFKVSSPTPTKEQPLQKKSVYIHLIPENTTVDKNDMVNLTVEVDPIIQNAKSVKIELMYDVDDLRFVGVKQEKSLQDALVLINNIDKENGKITYELGSPPEKNSLAEFGRIAVFSFVKISTTDHTKTTISLLPTTEIKTNEGDIFETHLQNATISLSPETQSTP